MSKKGILEFANDKLGQEVRVGDIVVCPDGRRDLSIGRVEKVTPKQFKIKKIQGNYRTTVYKPHNETISIHDMEATVLYLLGREIE